MFGLLKEPKVLIGIALMILGTAIGGITMQRASARVGVWQLDHALAAGSVLTAEDVHIAEVAGDVSAYVDAGTPVLGKTLANALAQGTFVPKSAFGNPVINDEIMVPADALHMPDHLRPGELVDVWVTTEEPVSTTRVLRAVRVVGTVSADIGGARGVQMAVASKDTGVLVAAMHRGVIDLVRVR